MSFTGVHMTFLRLSFRINGESIQSRWSQTRLFVEAQSCCGWCYFSINVSHLLWLEVLACFWAEFKLHAACNGKEKAWGRTSFHPFWQGSWSTRKLISFHPISSDNQNRFEVFAVVQNPHGCLKVPQRVVDLADIYLLQQILKLNLTLQAGVQCIVD